MKKIILIVVVVVALLGAFAYSADQYQKNKKPAPVTYTQAQYDAVSHEVATHDAQALSQISGLQAQVQKLTAQRDAVCAQVKAARLIVNLANCQ